VCRIPTISASLAQCRGCGRTFARRIFDAYIHETSSAARMSDVRISARRGWIFSVYTSSVNHAGWLEGSQFRLATSFRRCVSARCAWAVGPCEATRPAAAALTTCSVATVRPQGWQYSTPQPIETPQVRQILSGFGAAFFAGSGAESCACLWCRCVNRVGGRTEPDDLAPADQSICTTHSAKGATA
jgi:hypothetical protein